MSEKAIERAIRIAGGPAKAARLCNTSRQNVHRWMKKGRVTPDFVLVLSRATGWQIRPHDLRPDIYPDPEWVPPYAEVGE